MDIRVSEMSHEELQNVINSNSILIRRDTSGALQEELALEFDNERGPSTPAVDISFSFVISPEEYSNRAMLFDGLVSQGNCRAFLQPSENLWKDLDVLKDQNGICFILPCSSTGRIIDAEFVYREVYVKLICIHENYVLI